MHFTSSVTPRRLVLNSVEFPGLVFQVAVPGHGVLIRGGRYDRLCIDSGAGERVAAGMTVYLGRLLSCVEQSEAEQPSGWEPNIPANSGEEVDVLVCRLVEGRSEEQMSVLGQLWQAGIRADVSLLESSNLRGHIELAQSVGAQHLVIIRSDKVTIKQLNKANGGRSGKKSQHDEVQKEISEVAKHFIEKKILTASRFHGQARFGTK